MIIYFVTFPINSMVIFPSVLCKRLPEGWIQIIHGRWPVVEMVTIFPAKNMVTSPCSPSVKLPEGIC